MFHQSPLSGAVALPFSGFAARIVAAVTAVAFAARLVGIALVADQCEIKLFAVEVGAGHLYFHAVAKGVFLVMGASYEAKVLLIKLIVVIIEIAHRHKTFAHVFVKFDVEAPFGHRSEEHTSELQSPR